MAQVANDGCSRRQYIYNPQSQLLQNGEPVAPRHRNPKGAQHYQPAQPSEIVEDALFLWRQISLGRPNQPRYRLRFAADAPFFVTHEIEPDVDDARSYLIQDLLASDYLHAFGWLKGVGRAPQDKPRINLTGDPYFTDGLRAMMVITSKPASEDEIELLDWDSSSE